jgi:nitroreductase
MKTLNSRTAEHDIDDVFLKRSSPRAMSGEPLSTEELMTLIEAAHWAPSANNNQPWRFIYAIKGTPDFDLFLSFLKESNQVWCKNAGALLIEFSKIHMDDGKDNLTHSFDAGSAWENLALQGTHMGLVVHAMAGYINETLRETLGVSDEYQTEAMIAIGHPGNIADLPEKLQEREKPSQRKSVSEIAFEGKEGASKLI